MSHVAMFPPQPAVQPCSKRSGLRTGRGASTFLELDPLDEDLPTDLPVTLTQRQLLRLIVIAADTGDRFQRETLEVDPVTWLLSSRNLFHGLAAIDACKDLEHFTRAIVLHGLSLGFDADPLEIDALTDGRPVDGESDSTLGLRPS